MAHVISYILLALVMYAYKGMNAADFTHLDNGIKKNLGWIVCFLFALEGVFGMVPAIYMDVATGKYWVYALHKANFNFKIESVEYFLKNVWMTTARQKRF